MFLPYKSGRIEEEMREGKHAVFLLGGEIEDVVSFVLPGTDMERTILKIKGSPEALSAQSRAAVKRADPLKKDFAGFQDFIGIFQMRQEF